MIIKNLFFSINELFSNGTFNKFQFTRVFTKEIEIRMTTSMRSDANKLEKMKYTSTVRYEISVMEQSHFPKQIIKLKHGMTYRLTDQNIVAKSSSLSIIAAV